MSPPRHIAQAKLDFGGGRSPQAKAHASVVTPLGAERHFMTALHSILLSCHCHHCRGAPSTPRENEPAGDRQRWRHAFQPLANRFPAMCPCRRPNAPRHGIWYEALVLFYG